MPQENVELIHEGYRLVNEGGFAAIADFIDPAFEMDSPQREISQVDSERVIAVVRTSGRAKGSGIEIDQDLTHLWTLRQGKAVRFNTYSTKQEALEAAGLEE